MLNLLFNELRFVLMEIHQKKIFIDHSFLDVKCQCPNETLSFNDVFVEVKYLDSLFMLLLCILLSFGLSHILIFQLQGLGLDYPPFVFLKVNHYQYVIVNFHNS